MCNLNDIGNLGMKYTELAYQNGTLIHQIVINETRQALLPIMYCAYKIKETPKSILLDQVKKSSNLQFYFDESCN